MSQNLYTCYLMAVPPLCVGSVGAGNLSLWFHEYIHRGELYLWDWKSGFFKVCSQEPHLYHFRWLRWWKFWLWAGEIKMIFWTLNWCCNEVIILWALGKSECILYLRGKWSIGASGCPMISRILWWHQYFHSGCTSLIYISPIECKKNLWISWGVTPWACYIMWPTGY